MNSENATAHEVDRIGAGRDGVIRKQRAAVNLKIRHEGTSGREIPFQVDGIKTRAVGSVGRLKYQEHWNGVNRVLEPPFEKAGPVWTRQNPTVAHTRIPHPCVFGPPGNGVAATRPHLQLSPAVLRRRLRFGPDRKEKQREKSERVNVRLDAEEFHAKNGRYRNGIGAATLAIGSGLHYPKGAKRKRFL